MSVVTQSVVGQNSAWCLVSVARTHSMAVICAAQQHVGRAHQDGQIMIATQQRDVQHALQEDTQLGHSSLESALVSVLLARMHLAELRVQMSVNTVYLGSTTSTSAISSIRPKRPRKSRPTVHLGVRIASSMWVGPTTKKVASS